MLKSIKSFYKISLLISKVMFIPLTFHALLKAVLPFVSLYFSAQILNFVLAKNIDRAITSAIWLISLTAVIMLFESFTMHFLWYYKAHGTEKVDAKIMQKAMEFPYTEYEKAETMDTIRRTRVSSANLGGFHEQIQGMNDILQSLFSLIFAVLFLVNLFVSIDYTSVGAIRPIFLTLGFVIFYIALTFFAYKISGGFQTKFKKFMKDTDHQMGVGIYWGQSIMNLKNAKDIRLYQMTAMLQNYIRLAFCGKDNRYTEFARSNGKNSALISLLNRIAEMTAFLFIVIQAASRVIGVGDIMLYTGAINRFSSDLVTLIGTTNTFAARQDYLDAYNDFLDKEYPEDSGDLSIDFSDVDKLEFELRNLSFSYPESEHLILDNLSLKFHLNETTAIVGQNGAGKTTLIKLLCRLYEPTKGEIVLNGININRYQKAEYLKLFSVVFQDFQLFSFNLDENIACGYDMDEEKVWKCLEDVSLKDRVLALKEGIKTKLFNDNGEGVNLSGGEAQRVAIARALYKDAPFVILDEPTAALDPIMEMGIYADLKNLTANKTSIFISHRMGSCKFCDRIYVLEGGKLLEDGTHEILMDKQGLYAKLFSAQEKYYR